MYYIADGAPCGGDLTNSRGEFFSPQYPNNYPDYAYCTWRLRASDGHGVHLTFTFIELEGCCDSIRVYDGPTDDYPLLGQLPQDQKHEFKSTRNNLTVVFRSDVSVTRQGFRAQWVFSAPCGGDLTNSRGELFSPQYPNNYPNNANCTWRLLAPDGQGLHLRFTFTDLEECCDSIRVYDGPTNSYPLLGQLPQDQKHEFKSTRNNLAVVFRSDGSVTRQGFRAQWEFSAPCGGDLTNSRGELFSPQYPNNYPNNANCTWRLLAPDGQGLHLRFTFTDLEECCDSIRVYDGPTNSYPLLGQLPQDQKHEFKSTRNNLAVVFRSDGSVTGQGFRAQWEFSAPCGGDLTNSRGEFFSPQYPNNYPNNANCTWRLLAPDGQGVHLRFTFIELEGCCDSIRVYDGPTNSYPLLGQLPQDQKNEFKSTRNNLAVVFRSDGSVTRQGFRAQWEFSAGAPCGGDLTNSRGEFFSPQYPNNYPNNADCTWRLLASEGKDIYLNFTFTELEGCCDSIRVYDGPTYAYPLLGRLPQDQIHFKSTRNLTVVFRSDGSVTRQGFRAQWEFAAGAPCGGDLTNTRGEFFSPQYPNNYPDNADCTWRLLASEGQDVYLNFRFTDLEKCCDSIRVYDGPTDSYPLLGELPQDQIRDFKSTRNNLTVVFRSDVSVTHQGFRAQWEFSAGAPCGRDLTNSRGEFFSPQYPNNYPNNADCTWRLLASEGQGIYLNFTFTDLEKCCDSIRVYDGPTDSYPLLGRLPQDQINEFNSTRNNLTVVFRSDGSVTRQGFQAQWEFLAGAPCGGDLTYTRGEFFSPQYPNNYPNSAYCTWRLLASEGQGVYLNFTRTDLEKCCDSIRVYDGPTDSYPLLGQLPQDQIHEFNSTRNNLTVVFRSDGSVTRQGFRAQWEFSEPTTAPSTVSPEPTTDPLTPTTAGAPCGGDLTYTRGEFFSPQYPNNYPNSAYCTWRLLASEGQGVYLNFTRTDLEKCCDSIRVYDGPTDTYPLLGQLPQDQIHEFNSTRNNLTVVFRSDGSVTRQGFQAQWEFSVLFGAGTNRMIMKGIVIVAVRWKCGYDFGSCSCSSSCQYYGDCCPDYYEFCFVAATRAEVKADAGAPCGGDLTNSRGEFFSPQYPNNYPNYANCTWRLLPSEGQDVYLTFTFTELEECCDSIRVYGGPTDAYPLLGELPQDQKHEFNSKGSNLTIVFTSDSCVTHQGFRAQWEFSDPPYSTEPTTTSSTVSPEPTTNPLTPTTDCSSTTTSTPDTPTEPPSEPSADPPEPSFNPPVPTPDPDVRIRGGDSGGGGGVGGVIGGVIGGAIGGAIGGVIGGISSGVSSIGGGIGGGVSGGVGSGASSGAGGGASSGAGGGASSGVGGGAGSGVGGGASGGAGGGASSGAGGGASSGAGGGASSGAGGGVSSGGDIGIVIGSSIAGGVGVAVSGGGADPDYTETPLYFTEPLFEPSSSPSKRSTDPPSTTSDTPPYSTEAPPEPSTVPPEPSTYSFTNMSEPPREPSSSPPEPTVDPSTPATVKCMCYITAGAPCGGDLTNSRGEFFSPQYPNNYPNSAYCTWRLLASEGQGVYLTFTFTELEGCCDSIRVYDGPTHAFPLLGSLPQDQIHFKSTRNNLTVVFRSDGSVTRQGFRAQWEFSDTSPYSTEALPGPSTVPPEPSTVPPEPSTYSSTNTSEPPREPSSSLPEPTIDLSTPAADTSPYSTEALPGPSTVPPEPSTVPPEPLTYSSTNTSEPPHEPSSSLPEPTIVPSTPATAGAPCGGDLTNSRGEFFSPQYPNNYPNNADCTWRLLASEGQGVYLNFTFTELEGCCDSIRVYDGPTHAFPLLGSLPQDQIHFKSTRNNLTVVFRSDGSVTRQGFRAQWEFSDTSPYSTEALPGPSTVPPEPSTVPPEPSTYSSTNTSEPPREPSSSLPEPTIDLSTPAAEALPGPSTVPPEPSTVPPEPSTVPPEPLTYSSTNTSEPPHEPSSSLPEPTIVPSTPAAAGAPCGGDLTNSRGEFFSPQYPNNYPNNADCTWRLLASEGQGVYLNFTFTELEGCCDSIRVYDGPTHAFPLLGSLPQDQIHFKSTRNNLTVVFRSDGSVTRQGFRAQWEFSDTSPYSTEALPGPSTVPPEPSTVPPEPSTYSSTNTSEPPHEPSSSLPEPTIVPSTPAAAGAPCGGDLTNSRGEFFSPQYPNNYPNNADCTWRLLASEGQGVYLNFTFTELEGCCDSIRVYDGPTHAFPLLGSLPQDQIHFKSTRNNLTVVFRSDGSVTRQGFRAQWEFSDTSPYSTEALPGPSTVPPEPSTVPPEPSTVPPEPSTYSSTNTSEPPREPSSSLPEPTIDLSTPAADTSPYSTEALPGPSTVPPEPSAVPPEPSTYSSTNTSEPPHEPSSSLPEPTIVPSTPAAAGAPCGGDLTNSRGEFFSPQYPNNYPNNADCTWRLLASEGQGVYLNFTFTELEGCCDSIRVYDGPTHAFPLLGSLPQDQIHFKSTRNNLTVVFRSDGSVTRQGFRAQWEFSGTSPYSTEALPGPSTVPPEPSAVPPEPSTYSSTNTSEPPHEPSSSLPEPTIVPSTPAAAGAPCGGDLTNSRGEFFSPQYPNNYPNNADCTWRLLASEGQGVYLNFTFTELEGCCDSIRVYDGPTHAFPLLGSLPQDQIHFKSTRNNLTVVFRSDGSVTRQGFRAQWEFSGTSPYSTEALPGPSTVPPEPSAVPPEPSTYSFSTNTSGYLKPPHEPSSSLPEPTIVPSTPAAAGAPCGGDLTNSRGRILQPPVELISQIPLFFPSTRLEGCCDSIRVYDGPTHAFPLLGSLPQDQIHFKSTRNNLTVVFRSDGSVTRQGFRAQWEFSG
ncbi:hypothetical protein NFI96_028562 [Prochilodus magdalenae]|nr:hypothetical protein NFI96_028562 [Prochilodus magdalenae]